MNYYYQIYFGTDDDVTSRAMEEEVDRILLKSAILKLNSREKNIMELRFGFNSGVEKNAKRGCRYVTEFHKVIFPD